MNGRLSYAVLAISVGIVLPYVAVAEDAVKSKQMTGKLTKVEGTMEVQKFGHAGWTQAKEGMEIGPGDQIAAGIDGKAQLVYPNSQTDIEPLAQMAVGKSEESENQFRTDLFLQIGNIKAHVEKQGKVSDKSNRFTVTTPSSVAGIRGTTLDIGFAPGIGTVASIPEGAGYAQQLTAEQMSPEVQQLLGVGPAAEAAGPEGVGPATGGEAGEQPVPTEIAGMELGGADLGEAVDLAPGVGQAAFAEAARGPDVAGPMVIPPDAVMTPGQFMAMVSEAFHVSPSVLMGGMQQAGAPLPVGPSIFLPPPTMMEAAFGAAASGGGFLGGGPGGLFAPISFIDPLTNPDKNGDGVPDFRAEAFGLVNFTLTGDDDGDGWTNEQEFKGGSNPKDRSSAPGATTFGATAIAYNGLFGQFAGFGGATGDANGDGITNQFAFDAGLMLNVSFVDADQDGIPSDWEIAHGLNPNLASDANSDPDGDGRTNRDEFFFHTNPFVVDASAASSYSGDRDNDGMPNEWEVFNGLNPDLASDGAADADGDGYTNSAEFFGGSNPRSATSTPSAQTTAPPASQDADLDGLPNDWELANGFNPNLASDASQDADADGYTNLQEFQGFSNPRLATSVPFSGGGGTGDNDNDMSFNQEEILVGTNQSDVTKRPYYLGAGSGLAYGVGIEHSHGMAPGSSGDGDAMPDLWESVHGLNAATNDATGNPDGDGFTNLQEYLRGGDPMKFNSSLPTQTDVGSLTIVQMYEFREPNSDKLIGAHFDDYTGGTMGPYRVYYMPDKANTGEGYNIGTWAQTSGTAGMGYVNVGGTNMGGDATTRPTIVDADGDGHSPIGAFAGTVFFDSNDNNFAMPMAQSPGATTSPMTWVNNPNPFHH